MDHLCGLFVWTICADFLGGLVVWTVWLGVWLATSFEYLGLVLGCQYFPQNIQFYLDIWAMLLV